MKSRMSLAVFVAAVMGLQLALTVSAEAQMFGLRRGVPFSPVYGPRIGAVPGPGPGVIARGATGYGVNSQQPGGAKQMPTSQLYFIGPQDMVVHWDVFVPGTFDSTPNVAPFRQNFLQGAIYRLKLTNVPGRENNPPYYPTIEVAATMARSQAFLAHNSIPVEFTDNDFDQVDSGNFITKVIYLPDPEFQGLAMAGVGTLVNTQLEPGADPIVEADNRGSILAIIRLGNKDLGEPDVASFGP